MKNLIILFVLICSLQANGQEKKDFMLSFGIGVAGTPSSRLFENPKTGIGYAIDANYFITKRHIFSVNYTSANHDFIYNPYQIGSSTPFLVSIETSQIEYRAFSLIYKYRVISTDRFSLALGTGFSLLDDRRKLPMYEIKNNYWQFQSFYYGGNGTDLLFPLKAEMSLHLSKHWAVGIEAGIFYKPDTHPWAAFHYLPRLSYVF